MDEHATTREPEAESTRPQPRPVRVMLRDGRIFEANIHSYEGELLPRLLAARERFVNFTVIRWQHGGPEEDHLSVRVGHILWIGSPDGGIPLSAARQTVLERPVRVHLEHGRHLEAVVRLAEEYRISDFFENAGDFVPLHRVRFPDLTGVPDALALQQDAIIAVADLGEEPPSRR